MIKRINKVFCENICLYGCTMQQETQLMNRLKNNLSFSLPQLIFYQQWNHDNWWTVFNDTLIVAVIIKVLFTKLILFSLNKFLNVCHFHKSIKSSLNTKQMHEFCVDYRYFDIDIDIDTSNKIGMLHANEDSCRVRSWMHLKIVFFLPCITLLKFKRSPLASLSLSI